MAARVLLVAWKGASAVTWVEALEAQGYTVLLETTTGERAWRTAKERGIQVVIIDGATRASAGRETGKLLRDTIKTASIPIIWTNLDPQDIALVLAEVRPNMTVVAPTDVVGALAALEVITSKSSVD